MDISLLISQSMKYAESTFDLIKTLNRIHTELFSAFVKKRIDFKIFYPESYSEYLIVCDEGLIEKIIKQLLSNSLKFTDKGVVSFGFEENMGKIKLFVSDSGPGLSEESLSHATDFFYKTDFVNDKTNDGSGLGLSIVKGIVDMLKGELELKNNNNSGLEVSVLLDLCTNSIKKPIESKIKNGAVRKENLSILIAEDDDTNYLYLENMLRYNGFTNNQRAYNGLEAVEICESNSIPDIIFMDIKMPIMDGIEATRKIKEKNDNVIIVATTAYAMKEEVEVIMKEKFDGYIAKPFTSKQLLDCINDNFND
jgi:CheY-like chemotaxis protein/two-component sensor histidine kinase